MFAWGRGGDKWELTITVCEGSDLTTNGRRESGEREQEANAEAPTAKGPAKWMSVEVTRM